MLPDAVRSAFIAAQSIDFELKAADARKIVYSSAALAAAAGAAPLPFSDAIAIVPIQIRWIAGISLRFGIEGTSDKLLPLASSVIGCMAATAAGRIIVGQILKLIPTLSLVTARSPLPSPRASEKRISPFSWHSRKEKDGSPQ